jgi:hypothetical protein
MSCLIWPALRMASRMFSVVKSSSVPVRHRNTTSTACLVKIFCAHCASLIEPDSMVTRSEFALVASLDCKRAASDVGSMSLKSCWRSLGTSAEPMLPPAAVMSTVCDEDILRRIARVQKKGAHLGPSYAVYILQMSGWSPQSF